MNFANRGGGVGLLEKLILLGFGLLTTVIGARIGFVLNRRMWRAQTAHTIYRASYEEGTKFLDEMSELVGRRFFLLQRFYWAIEGGNEEKKDEAEKEYFATVKDWNSNYWKYRNKIRILIGERQAMEFLDYDDDGRGEKPLSLHYKFVAAHRKVMKFRQDTNSQQSAAEFVQLVNWGCSVFLERMTGEFVKRAADLRLLDLPTGPGGAELAASGRNRPP